MSATTVDIVYGIAGQALYLDAEDRPTSVTSVTVYENSDGDDATAQGATTGSASVDTNPDTTIDADSGSSEADPRVLNVAATTGFATGRDYLVTGTNGESERFEVREIASASLVIARNPLHNAYVNTNPVVSTRMSISVDDTWAATETKISDSLDPNQGYRVRWVWVDAGGTTRARDTYFDLVRYPGKGTTVTPTDIERLVPGFLNQLPTYHREDQGAALIAEAYEQVKLDMHQEDRADQTLRNREVLDELVKRKTIELWADARLLQGTGTIDQFERAMSAYQERLDSFVRRTTKVPYSTDTTGAAREVSSIPLTRR